MKTMWRSLPICWLVAELLVAPAVFASGNEKCEANCAAMKKKFEKTCKEKFGGSCSGRGKALVKEFDKACTDDCAKRKPR